MSAAVGAGLLVGTVLTAGPASANILWNRSPEYSTPSACREREHKYEEWGFLVKKCTGYLERGGTGHFWFYWA